MFRAFVFDVGGTIVKTDEALILAVKKALEENGVKLRSKRPAIESLGISTHFIIEQSVRNSYSGTRIRKKIEDCYNSYKKIFPIRVLSAFRAFPYVKPTLNFISSKGKISVLTGFNTKECMAILKHVNLMIFDNYITVTDVKKPRPDKESLILALKRLKVNRNELLYIGDTVADIKMAHNAKVKIACVKTGVQPNNMLSEQKPDYLIDSVADLKQII